LLLIVYCFSGLGIESAPFKIVVSFIVLSLLTYRHIARQPFFWDAMNQLRGGLLCLASGSVVISMIARALYVTDAWATKEVAEDGSSESEEMNTKNAAAILLLVCTPLMFGAGIYAVYWYRKRLTDRIVRLVSSAGLKGKNTATVSTIRSAMQTAILNERGNDTDFSKLIQVGDGLKKLDQAVNQKSMAYDRFFQKYIKFIMYNIYIINNLIL
jgi:hypothetical protein